MRRGKVWWHEPPDKKARPALIFSRDEVLDGVFDNRVRADARQHLLRPEDLLHDAHHNTRFVADAPGLPRALACDELLRSHLYR
jgi:hypothetical protein